MTKAITKMPAKELSKNREKQQSSVAVIPETKSEKRFRDDGICPECLAELEHDEGMFSCSLCGYCECE